MLVTRAPMEGLELGCARHPDDLRHWRGHVALGHDSHADHVLQVVTAVNLSATPCTTMPSGVGGVGRDPEWLRMP